VARASAGDQVRDEDRWDLETARAAAVREVAALLAKPDNLGRVGKLKAEYETQRSAVQVRADWKKGAVRDPAARGHARAGRLVSSFVVFVRVRAGANLDAHWAPGRGGARRNRPAGTLSRQCATCAHPGGPWRTACGRVRARAGACGRVRAHSGACGRCGLIAVEGI
jgi:hypothetical protein